MIQDWDIKPRGSSCVACDTAFADNQLCCSALIFGNEGYSRRDFCEACWREKAGTERVFSQWTGVFQKPAPPPAEPLKKETAEDLLRKLMENNDPSKKNVIYILAVMLERKRILVEKEAGVRDDGVLIRVYEHRKTGETFLIPDPNLGFDQLGEVQREVAALLGADKPARPPAGAEAKGQQTEDGGQKMKEKKTNFAKREDNSDDRDDRTVDADEDFDEEDDDEFEDEDEDLDGDDGEETGNEEDDN